MLTRDKGLRFQSNAQICCILRSACCITFAINIPTLYAHFLEPASTRNPNPKCDLHKTCQSEPLSKLRVSPLITPIVVSYIIPYITPFKEFRLWPISGQGSVSKSLLTQPLRNQEVDSQLRRFLLVCGKVAVSGCPKRPQYITIHMIQTPKGIPNDWKPPP